MPTHQLLNGLSGNLQSSTTWAQQQALDLIQRNVVQAMSSLTAQEQALYLKLQREAQQALTALDRAKNALVQAFKTQGLAQLRDKLEGRDPEQYRIYTTYLEKREQPFPWDPPPRQRDDRPRRAYDEWQFTLHTKDMTLWEAACLNFGFTHSIIQDSGFSQVEASEIVGPGPPLDTLRFINTARALNLGGQLRVRTDAALGENGRLRNLFATAAKATLQFDLLESWRLRATTGLTQPVYDALRASLTERGPSLAFDTLGLTSGLTLIVSVPFVPWENVIPLPLLLIRVASLGVVTYFPQRPGGAFRYHIDAQAGEADLRQQLKDSQQQQDLGWFSRQLPLIGLSVFTSLLNQEPRPEGLNWLAGPLYDGFHTAFAPRTLDTVRFTADAKTGRPLSLVDAFTRRLIQRYQSDLATLATERSEADWRALKDAVAAVAGEVLHLLLTPMPGGVSGMNRIMQLTVLGSMTYSLAQGLDDASKGQANSFASALADLADLAISGRLMSVAGRAHRLRMLNYLETLGNPRKVIRPDGTEELWKPDASPYAYSRQNLLDGRTADALGIYTLDGKTYAKLREGAQTLVVEVRRDPHSMRYTLKHGTGASYTPPILFEPALQAWVFDLKNAHTLSDVQLLQRMLPNGSSITPDVDLELMLRSTSTTRTALDAVWSEQAAPLNLIEGVRRLQADQVIQQIIERFEEPGYLPPHGDSLVFCLLTQLPGWPADTLLSVRDEHGVLIETYSPSVLPSPTSHTVYLTRQEDGRYGDADNQRLPPGTVDPLLRLIMRQQPGASSLGKDGGVTHSEEQRLSHLRRQVAQLAARERLTLFNAVVNYAGYEKTELIPPLGARRFLPLKAAPPLVTVTPLLKKLRDLNQPLSTANLKRLLEQEPLTPRQQQDYLQHGTLPLTFRDLLDHQRTALRIDAVIDGLYHPREFTEDIDQWAREFASALVRHTLKRPFVVNDVASGDLYASTGPDDPTVALRHYGGGDYRAYDMRNGGEIPVSPPVDSFYLAIGSVLQPHEHRLLGMSSADDAKGLRKTLGDYMSTQRSPEGFVSLVNGSLVQYEQQLVLPLGLTPKADGPFEFNARHYLPLQGSLYRIAFDKDLLKWRLVHPQKIGVNTPTLEHNGDGAWRLSSENPMTWDNHRLLYRLGNHRYAFTEDMAGKIMALTDTSPEVLRQVHRSGRAAPPLLADTCKRFKIDEEIQLFLKAIRIDPAAKTARPEIQLLALIGLRGWPSDHVLQIVDEQQRVLKQYPDTAPATARRITVTEQDYLDGKLLGAVIKNDHVCQGLLAETPASDDERLFKLVTKIVAYTEQERMGFLDSIYASSERNGSAQEKRFKAKHPNLPTSTVKAILSHASPRELKQLNENNQVGLRLSEQARLSSHDLRLNRAYEGLYLPSCANPDSDKIALYLLKFLPDWPRAMRVDIHQGDPHGRLLESAGHLDGAVRRLLARTDRGYQAYDAAGRPMGSASNRLLPALVTLLSASEQASLGITDTEDLSTLREQLVALALGRRVEIKGVLGLPHLQPWMQPPMRVDRSFLAYPIWQWHWPFGANRPLDLVSKVQELYPSFSSSDAQRFIGSLNKSEPLAMIELDRRQAEYSAMDTELTRWSDTYQAMDDPDNDPLGQHLGRRRFVANQLRRAWRREEPRRYITGLFHVHSLALQLDDINLPPASFIASLTGFEHIEHLKISGNAFPDSGDAFLGKFSGLNSLEIDCSLHVLPQAITVMTQLTHLNLSRNGLVLTDEASARLANMVGLKHLDLSNNALGNTPDVSRLNQLTYLNLRNTQISQWPTGTWELPGLLTLHLEDNLISSIPEQVLTDTRLATTNRNTFLHSNPLSGTARQQIADYRRRNGIDLGGALGGLRHIPGVDDELNQWLDGVPGSEYPERKLLWESLLLSEETRPDDAFQVLRDLTQTYAYVGSRVSREALTTRVWTLLLAMGESTELRNNVFLNTYGSGDCGDSALLAFTKMELEHRIHQAKNKPRTYESDRELIALSTGRFYLNQLDHISDNFIRQRELANLEVDPAEVCIYFRAQMAAEFDLPFYPLELLYTVERYVTDAVLDDARVQLRRLGQSPALQEWLLTEGFWIEYLARSHPEPFSTIKDRTQYKVRLLERELPNKTSDEYLERRQSLVDWEKDEHDLLVRQLTVATQAALQHA